MSEPVLVYDDDCGFCTWWADRVARRTEVRLVGFSELSGELRDRLPEEYEDCAHLVTDDEVYSCGECVEQVFVRSDLGEGTGPVVDFLRNFEDYESIRESLYRWGADRRDLWGKIVSKSSPTATERRD